MADSWRLKTVIVRYGVELVYMDYYWAMKEDGGAGFRIRPETTKIFWFLVMKQYSKILTKSKLKEKKVSRRSTMDNARGLIKG